MMNSILNKDSTVRVPFFFVCLVFTLFSFSILVDLYMIYFSNTDVQTYGKYIEGLIFLTGLICFASYLLSFLKEKKVRAHHSLEIERIMKEKALQVKGFEAVLNVHFDVWKLSEAERDVAIHLLKGLNSQEISSIRFVSERTIRNQSHSIYSKSGLSGKHDLAAYFLKEFLVSR